jgi:hypothetical protein
MLHGDFFKRHEPTRVKKMSVLSRDGSGTYITVYRLTERVKHSNGKDRPNPSI